MEDKLLVPGQDVHQPPLANANLKCELTVAIASLSIGGAERIVLDWAARIHPRWKVHLIVLRNREKEWPVPPFIRVTRLVGQEAFKNGKIPGGEHDYRLKRLRELGREIAASENPVCVCHLLRKDERDALAESGASTVNVLHNAKAGWPEGTEFLSLKEQVIAVSEACANDLRELGWKGSVSVIRHIPPCPAFSPSAREDFRKAWRIPQDATVIGMIGSIKAQKNYVLAIQIMAALLKKRNAYLVIIGGCGVKNGIENRDKVMAEIRRLGIINRVAMPGPIPNAALCLPAFDVVLNTSHFEGLSIATLEALVSGLPVVASRVGGQGELCSEGLALMDPRASKEEWADALLAALQSKPELPSWMEFKSHRLWTLAGLARDIEPDQKVLFVTANLNSGGAQRSLVNLSLSLRENDFPFSIAVAGNSTEEYFYLKLRGAGIPVVRLSETRIAFDNAEALVHKICSENIGTVCFWNLDPKVKLLAVKALGFTSVRFIDVSPGNESFDGFGKIADFQRLVGFSEDDYHQRLDQLVLKYRGFAPALCHGKTFVIPNGIPEVKKAKTDYAIRGNPRVVVCGRIAPTKFLLEILEAMRLVRKEIPQAELHVFGAAEPLRLEYAKSVYESAEADIGRSVFFHGLNFEAVTCLPDYDAYVVLGKDQGCPNALLEALACGLPAVANDDGGTREQLIDMETGLLVRDCSPEPLAEAVISLLRHRDLAKRLGEAGREHVMNGFPMRSMRSAYAGLFGAQCSEEIGLQVFSACSGER